MLVFYSGAGGRDPTAAWACARSQLRSCSIVSVTHFGSLILFASQGEPPSKPLTHIFFFLRERALLLGEWVVEEERKEKEEEGEDEKAGLGGGGGGWGGADILPTPTGFEQDT